MSSRWAVYRNVAAGLVFVTCGIVWLVRGDYIIGALQLVLGVAFLQLAFQRKRQIDGHLDH